MRVPYLRAVRVAVLARQLPKVELHCHLEGSARPSTIVELAKRNGVALPVDDPTELFHFSSLTEFLEVYGIVCSSLRSAEDLRRITYEALEDAAGVGIRYREMFFSPGFLVGNGITLEQIWSGISAGLDDAHADLDIRCRMILDVDKGADPAAAVELVRFAAAQDRDKLVGVGGDNTEKGIDHRSFAPAFELAAREGLHRTMHAGEDGPAENIAVSLDVLGCERIDHGVRLVDDPALTARVARERVPLTMCPLSNVILSATVPRVASHPFAALRMSGVLATINSDDPGMSATTIADDYEQIASAFGYSFGEMAAIALDGIEACWAPPGEKRVLRARFEREIGVLGADRSGG